MALIIGIPKEIHPDERRVAATPHTIERFRKMGLDVQVEAGAGNAAGFTDADYKQSGATVCGEAAKVWATSDILIKVRPPMARLGTDHDEPVLLKKGAVLVGFVWPAQHKELLEKLAAREATVFAMDCVPRITRAQKMDALSAMANIAGYRAVIEAAEHFGRFIPGQMTAAGKVAPARVLIVGAGVAGLAAIAAAKSLGAQVRAFDTRAASREQVESLGAQFVELDFAESGEGEGGYAREMSEAFLLAEQTLLARQSEQSDIIITTALIPGKPAPQLITSGAVVAMPHGGVIVDMAAEQGGNCALTERGRVVEKFGVTIVGLTDLPSRMARQSSELYAMTVLNLVSEFIEDGRIRVDLDDEVERGALVLHGGALTWPPPAKPHPRTGAPQPDTKAQAAAHAAAAASQTSGRMTAVLGASVAALLAVAAITAPPEFLGHLTVFLLACIVGWHVIWNVTPALHTPLMSVTNAISGIILVGGMLVMAGGGLNAAAILGAVAVLVATINVAGGFLVTQRMLRMFRK
ncbi:MAG TPA: Re/Si-specific NAD(P)(+) transhydrogenase subunit alpha [Vicinamibacterales bacterium]|nr:Re/Si-specific NAD(P)(+) transhydrogenase subunit alpha [Vicinamibacterales bacterium]